MPPPRRFGNAGELGAFVEAVEVAPPDAENIPGEVVNVPVTSYEIYADRDGYLIRLGGQFAFARLHFTFMAEGAVLPSPALNGSGYFPTMQRTLDWFLPVSRFADFLTLLKGSHYVWLSLDPTASVIRPQLITSTHFS